MISIIKINHVVIAYYNNDPISYGAVKEYTLDAIEVKQVFTCPNSRDKGVATQVLIELEK